jgi:hypothetical protein
MLADKCEQNEQAEYLDDLWDLLHHSDDEHCLMLGLTFYLDDSGSDDGSPLVTCGGVVMSRIDHREFSNRLARMYARKKASGAIIEPPLHMSDFAGRGKYATLYPEFKRNLFLDVARLINDHKFYSISIAISQTDFYQVLSEDVRRNLIGPYAFAFFSIVVGHQYLSRILRSGPIRTAYMIDRGFGHQDQLNQAHLLIVNFEQAMGEFRHTGAIATDTDDHVPALQAADVIAWASRRMVLEGSLPEGFEPLAETLREDSKPPHATIEIDRDGIEMLAKPINNWISKHGTIPKLTDIMSRKFRGFNVRLKDT